MTGALRMRWVEAHGSCRVTAMSFDLNLRRLLTGCENGIIKARSRLLELFASRHA